MSWCQLINLQCILLWNRKIIMRNWYWQLRPLSQFSMWRIAKWQSIFIYPQPALVSNNCPLPPGDRHADDKRKKRTVQCNNIIVKYHRLRKWKRRWSVPLEGATTTKIPYCSLRKTQPTDQLTVASSLSSSQDEADEAVKRRIIWGHPQSASQQQQQHQLNSLSLVLSLFTFSQGWTILLQVKASFLQMISFSR